MFDRFAKYVTVQVGTTKVFISAFLFVLGWFLSSLFIFGFSTLSQLFINTTTTIITFLMVFLIQHAQNTDIKAVHRKLDEIILSMNEASNALVALEDKTQDAVDNVVKEHQRRRNLFEDTHETIE